MAAISEPDHDDYWGTGQPVLLGWLRDTPDTTGNIPVVEFAVEQFNRLHRVSTGLEQAVLLMGLVVLWSVAKLPAPR